jgi:16S rRNA (adenine1518-N6/adenine1519-N6)-dimethyltransferase
MTGRSPSAEPGTPNGASPDGLPPLREVIARHGLAARKSLGQNFIQDLNLTRRIARLGGSLEGATVVEVGPGPGGLTRALLLEGARHVVAIERDDRCLPALEEIAARWPGRLTVHGGDALECDWPALIAGVPPPPDAQSTGGGQDVRIIANLPYGIATRLLVGWLETEPWPPWFNRMALMFQKEVAERIVAAPDTKPYGRLSVISQWRCRTRIAMTLSPQAFTPPPKVESAVVELVPRAELSPLCDVKTLGRVTGAVFGQRRKMLRSTLKSIHSSPEALLDTLEIAGDRRGETLSIEEIARIALAVGQS